MPQGSLEYHLNNQCPLEPVDCVFSWAGCNDKPLRKDVHEHTADTKHMPLLAVACGQLKKENEVMKKHVKMLQNENTILKDYVHNSTVPDSYPLLPIEIQIENKATVLHVDVTCQLEY